MFKINRVVIYLTIAFVIIGVGMFYFLQASLVRKSQMQPDSKQVIFVGAHEQKEMFVESVNSAKGFYDQYSESRRNIAIGNYKKAIELLNACLPHAIFGPEKAMIYYELAGIYKIQKNLEMELEYAELIPKYTASPDIAKEFKQRALELRQTIGMKNKN